MNPALLLLALAVPLSEGIETARKELAPEAKLAVYAAREDGTEIVAVNPDAKVVTASSIKILVLVEAHARAAAGDFRWGETYALKKEDRVGGGGDLQKEKDGTSETMAKLARRMMLDSDNIATNVLIRRLGMDKINARAEALGLKITRLNRYMMDAAARKAGIENWTTPREMATLWRKILRKEILTPEACAEIGSLAEEMSRDGIGGTVPKEIPVARKPGALVGIRNDTGYVRHPEKPYVAAVYAWDLAGDEKETKAKGGKLVEKVAELIYNAAVAH